MWKDTRAQRNFLVEITFSESVMTEFKFRGLNVLKVGIKNAKWIQLRNMVPSNLICTNEKLSLGNNYYRQKRFRSYNDVANLQMVVEFSICPDMQCGGPIRRYRQMAGRRLERLWAGQALV